MYVKINIDLSKDFILLYKSLLVFLLLKEIITNSLS